VLADCITVASGTWASAARDTAPALTNAPAALVKKRRRETICRTH
jgi:hypothetical protein